MPVIGEIQKLKKGRWLRNYMWAACLSCGKERWVIITRGQLRGKRCRQCVNKDPEWIKKQRLAQIRKKHNLTPEQREAHRSHFWKGGRRITRQGYVLVWIDPDDFFAKMANKTGCVFEHRLVMAKHLGRNLHLWELVHHKGTKYPKGSNEDKADNRIENLQLVTDDRHRQITILEERIKQLETKIRQLEEGKCQTMS